MDSSLGQVFKGVCLAVFLSSVHGHGDCTGEKIQLRGPEGWYCDGQWRQVEILCGSQLGTISSDVKDISSRTCNQLGCDGESEASRTTKTSKKDEPVWRVNCDDWNELSLTGCHFTRAKEKESLPIINVKCSELDDTSTLITIDVVEFALFFVTIILGSILLYHFVLWKFNSSSKENDQPKSRPTLSSSHVMVHVGTDDPNEPEAVDQGDEEHGERSALIIDSSCQEVTTEKAGHTSKHDTVEEEGTEVEETPELVYNPCYGAVTVKDEHSSKHETIEQEDTELGEIPESVDNDCYEPITEKAENSSNHDWSAEEGTESEETPELVYNVCYGAVTSNVGQSSTQDTSNEQEDTELGETTEFVDNVCYEGITEEAGRPHQTD